MKFVRGGEGGGKEGRGRVWRGGKRRKGGAMYFLGEARGGGALERGEVGRKGKGEFLLGDDGADAVGGGGGEEYGGWKTVYEAGRGIYE